MLIDKIDGKFSGESGSVGKFAEKRPRCQLASRVDKSSKSSDDRQINRNWTDNIGNRRRIGDVISIIACFVIVYKKIQNGIVSIYIFD